MNARYRTLASLPKTSHISKMVLSIVKLGGAGPSAAAGAGKKLEELRAQSSERPTGTIVCRRYESGCARWMRREEL